MDSLQRNWQIMPSKEPFKKRGRIRRNQLFTIVLLVLAFGVFLTLINIYELRMVQYDHITYHGGPFVEGNGGVDSKQPVVWVSGRKLSSGYLKHIYKVFERVGYAFGDENSSWDVLWAHDYPFSTLKKHISKLKPHQKVNHFPGSGYITNKVSLATSNITHIPKAFKIPQEKQQFKEYAKKNPQRQWVQKSSNHRGIKILKLQDLDLTKENTFIQEYIDDPFLIDGRRFDIGIYTTLTSIDPLRVYINQGDWLIRFCPEVYYPFDPSRILKYVVTDNYMAMWDLPSLSNAYTDQELSRKETLFTYLRKKGHNPLELDRNIQEAIRNVYKEKEPHLISSIKNWSNRRNFFEMVRFDFVVDKNLNVYLMEVNMSPNLSSGHFPENRLLYEQVIYGMLSLVGIASATRSDIGKSDKEVLEMQVSSRDVRVFVDGCLSEVCEHSCKRKECRLCKDCLTGDEPEIIQRSYLEHLNRRSWRRVFPVPFKNQQEAMRWKAESDKEFVQLKPKNQWITQWFYGMCLKDSAWCS